MAISQSASFIGQKPISEITRSEFSPIDDSEGLRLLPPGFENAAEAQQGIATYVKIFVLKVDQVAAVLSLIGRLCEAETVVKIALALPVLDVPFIKAVAKLIPQHVKFGVCDYDAAQLQTLINEGVQLTFCSINADACCALPKDILTLSRDTGIKLIAHHDPMNLNMDFGSAISRSISLYEKRQVVAYTTYHYIE